MFNSLVTDGMNSPCQFERSERQKLVYTGVANPFDAINAPVCPGGRGANTVGGDVARGLWMTGGPQFANRADATFGFGGRCLPATGDDLSHFPGASLSNIFRGDSPNLRLCPNRRSICGEQCQNRECGQRRQSLHKRFLPDDPAARRATTDLDMERGNRFGNREEQQACVVFTYSMS